ncbi:unnamed protein product, partial [Sphenostylis stenocarpa]
NFFSVQQNLTTSELNWRSDSPRAKRAFLDSSIASRRCGERMWGVGLVGRMSSVISVYAWSLWVLKDGNCAAIFRVQ